MPPNHVLRELERLAERLGIVVRHESFDLKVIQGKGGLCWLRGNPTVILDAYAPVVDKIGVLSQALAKFDVEAIYVPAPLRAR